MLAARSHGLGEYFNWAFEKEVKMDKARYPCLFSPGYPGIVAVEDIGPFETLISVPNDVLIRGPHSGRVDSNENKLLQHFPSRSRPVHCARHLFPSLRDGLKT